VEILVAMCERIIAETKQSKVPLGVSVESVSIFKNEKEAARDLFRLTQAVMLDAYGVQWSMRYAIDAPAPERANKGDKIKRIAAFVAAFLAGAVARTKFALA